MINTVLFDMDGLLLDTEPLWGESMLRVAERHGIPVGREHFRETTGLRIYEVTEYWAARFPWQGSSPQEVAEDILDDIIEAARTQGRVLPGVEDTLELLRTEGVRVGLASSSPSRMIEALVRHFGLYDHFDCITSADAVALGKPHPAVFLHCAEALGAKPGQCLVLEDSVNGMIAGKAARMKVVVVPDQQHYDHPGFALADHKLHSLEEFHLGLLQPGYQLQMQ
jgi:HAD superfamily hydrolase (TIGR01509 family)